MSAEKFWSVLFAFISSWKWAIFNNFEHYLKINDSWYIFSGALYITKADKEI